MTRLFCNEELILVGLMDMYIYIIQQGRKYCLTAKSWLERLSFVITNMLTGPWRKHISCFCEVLF